MQMDGQTAVMTKLRVTFHNFANHCMLYLLYITDNRAYYRLRILVNNALSLAIGFKTGILCSLKMVRLYQNM